MLCLSGRVAGHGTLVYLTLPQLKPKTNSQLEPKISRIPQSWGRKEGRK